MSHAVRRLRGMAPKANAGRRYRLYPDAVSAERLAAWGHTSRWVWNIALEQRNLVWATWHTTMRAQDQCRYLTSARNELAWLEDLPAQSAQEVLRRLDRAFANWLNPKHSARRPTYKKRGRSLSVAFPGQAVAVRKVNRRWAEVRIPKLGWIRFRLSRPLGGVVRNATITCSALGWHVSFGVATEAAPAEPNGRSGMGVDFGIACSAYCSDETSPRLLPATLTPGERRRLLGLERQQACQRTWAKRHNRGVASKRLRRTTQEIARLRGRQARRRADFTHKLTTDLAKNHGFVGIEDLRVKDMTRSARGTHAAPGVNVAAKRGLNREICDNAWGERRRQLTYKCLAFGSELVVVPAAGTSQTCAACGRRDAANRVGCGRLFACVYCGHVDQADRNAAKNIERIAAGQAVNSTRSRRLAARPSRSRMREPLMGSTA